MHRRSNFGRASAGTPAVALVILSACGGETMAPAPAATPSPAALAADFTPPSGPDLASPAESPGRFRVATATSADGMQFTAAGRVLSEQANTPDFIYGDGGRLFLYYTGWRLGGVTNTVAAAFSDDDGASWGFRNVSLSGFENGTNYGDQDVIAKPGGGLRLFLTTSVSGRIGIVYGDSSDGVRFNYGGVAASIAGDDVLDSTTFRVGATWHMLRRRHGESRLPEGSVGGAASQRIVPDGVRHPRRPVGLARGGAKRCVRTHNQRSSQSNASSCIFGRNECGSSWKVPRKRSGMPALV